MKKILLSLLILLGAGMLQAQIVITNNDLVGPGSTAIMSLDTMPAGTIVPGPGGPSQVWDFSALQEGWTDTIKFLKPSWTPYASLFPDANFAIRQFGVDNLYVMLYRDNSELSVMGMIMNFEQKVDTTIIIYMNPKQKVVQFPVEYGNTRKDTSMYRSTIPNPNPPPDSIRMQFTTIMDVNVDGWGTATIPMGTYDVLRIHEQRVEIDCTFIYMAGQWIFQGEGVDTSEIYTWWSDDDETGFYLVEMAMSSDLKGVVESVLYLKQTPTQSVEEDPDVVSIPVYPNPASTYVNIEINSVMEGVIEIRDMLGYTHKTLPYNGSSQHRISLEGMPAGVYLYTIRDRHNSLVYTGKFVKR